MGQDDEQAVGANRRLPLEAVTETAAKAHLRHCSQKAGSVNRSRNLKIMQFIDCMIFI